MFKNRCIFCHPKLKALLSAAWGLKFLFPFKELNALQTYARGFGALTFVYSLFRIKDWDILYGSNTFVPRDFALSYFPEAVRPWVYIFPESQWGAILMYVLMALILLASAFRPLPVLVKGVAWFLHLMFFHRNLPGIYGGDLILNAFYFYYVFSETKNQNIYKMLMISAQLQLIVVYFVSALAKLAGKTWIEGSAIGLVMQNEQMVIWSFDLLSLSPMLSAILSWWVLFFELGSPFGFTGRKTKPYWIWTGIGMHFFIACFMGLWFFSSKMLLAYVLFRPKEWPRSYSSSTPSSPMASTGQPSRAS